MGYPPLRCAVLTLSCTLATIICSCNKSGESSHASPSKQTSTPPAPTPNLDALASIAGEIPSDWSLLAMNFYPLPAALVLSPDAAPDEKPKLIAFLEGAQPTVLRAIEATKAALEPFPPLPEFNENNAEAILRHPKSVMQQLARLLLTDASRCVEARDLNGAFTRIAAALRIAATLNNQTETLLRITGSSILIQSCSKSAAIIDGGDANTVSAGASAEFRAELSRFDHDDPARLLPAWDRDARASVVECRATYAVRGGPKKYAEYIRSTDSNLNGILVSMGGLAVETSFADTAARLEPSEISAALDRAETMIPDIVAAMKTGDTTTLDRALIPARQDPTQMSRLVVGGAPLVARTLRDARAAMTKALEAADKLPR